MFFTSTAPWALRRNNKDGDDWSIGQTMIDRAAERPRQGLHATKCTEVSRARAAQNYFVLPRAPTRRLVRSHVTSLHSMGQIDNRFSIHHLDISGQVDF